MSKLDFGNSPILNSDIVVNGAEIKTGATYDGKPVYQTTIHTTMPGASNTDATRAHGIANISSVVSFEGVLTDQHPYWYPLNYYRSGSQWISCKVDRTNIVLAMGNDISIPLNRGVDITIYYTKTTD